MTDIINSDSASSHCTHCIVIVFDFDCFRNYDDLENYWNNIAVAVNFDEISCRSLNQSFGCIGHDNMVLDLVVGLDCLAYTSVLDSAHIMSDLCYFAYPVAPSTFI